MRMFGTKRLQGLEGAQRLARQFSHATLLVLLAVIATVTVALFWATHESDTVSVQRQERVARHSMNVALDELALQQETVAIWDESAMRMVSAVKDQKWLFDNLGSWLHRMFAHDESWLLDERNRPVQIVVHGRRVSKRHYWQRQKDVQQLIQGARGQGALANGVHDRNPRRRLAADSSVRTTERATHDTDLILVGGRPAAASVMLIQPSTDNYVGPRTSWPALVSIRYLDGSFARELEATHLIDRPRFSRLDDRAPNERSLLIGTERGEDLGYLIWTPELPGSRIIAALLPANLLAMTLLALLMAALLARLTNSLRERSALEERATYLAYHDSLTGLPNRSFFNECVDKALCDPATADVALLLIDLDRFKQVNDTLGHLAGDELIRQFAARLVGKLRPEDTVARIGGDEFAILLCGSGAAVALDRCEIILALFDEPFDLMGACVHGSASIGAARSQHQHIDGTELMRRADVALYRAKGEGRNCASLFEHGMDAASKERAQLEAELRHAVTANQFALWMQPLVDRDRKVVAQELLLRWEHPHLGTVNPDLILPIAEETGLIIPIGEWVMTQAIAFAAQAPAGMIIALNLSAAQLRDSAFVTRAVEACRAMGVQPQTIELEITEQTLLDDNRVTRASLRRLRRAGFRIALDDFGTGYSSLSYLRRFTVDTIKIDRSFVADLERSAEARAIVAAIITLGRALGLSITAEGVETAEQEEMLLLAGCDQLQGHFYARAQPLAEAERSAA
jgi:diguanylate cyclase (GGDEF)-like protein